MPRALLAPIVAAALLVPVGSAGAATLGSAAIGSPAGATVGCDAYPCVMIQDSIGGAVVRVPAGRWIVTSWRVRAASGPVALKTLRPTGGTSSSLEGTYTGQSASGTGNGADAVQQFATRMPVNGGDMFGLLLGSAGASVGIASAAPAPGTTLFEAAASPTFDTGLSGDLEQLLQITIEPDADGDGFGDQTQDGCPSVAATQGACPKAPGPPGPPDPLRDLRAGKKPKVQLARGKVGAPKGVVPVAVTNPNGYAVKGKVTLKRKKKKVGSRSYSIGAEGAKTVKVKLSRAARRQLKRKGKLKLNANATVKGPIGKKGTSKASLTVTKGKPRRRSGGGGGGGNWVGRTKNSTVKFSFDLAGGRMRNVVGGLMITCFYPNGTSRSAVEVYDPPGSFPFGRKTEAFANDKPSGILGTKTRKRYTMDATRQGDTVKGTIQMSYAFTAYNPSTGFFSVGSCVGQDTFTARPK